MKEDLLIIPGTPVLVPELSVGDPDAEELRAVVLSELSVVLDRATVPPKIVRLEQPGQDTAIEGSFRAWGADVSVGVGHYLPELVARWALNEFGVSGHQILATDRIPQTGPVIVVTDGPAALSAAAPLTLMPEAVTLDDACRAIAGGTAVREAAAVIRAGDTEACGLYSADLWLQLADRSQDLGADALHTRAYDAAPYGVGYHVARWSW